jgi:hypothetical protein
MTNPARLILLLGILAVLLLGCDGAPRKGTLKGKLLYKNRPVTGANVTFFDEQNNPVYPGMVEVDGNFLFAELPLGKLKVTIETESFAENKELDPATMPLQPGEDPSKMPRRPPSHKAKMPVYRPIPLHYADVKTTPLVVEVKAGTQQVVWELKDQ